MDPMVQFVSFLVEHARCRARAALGQDREAGALTLEWIVIAGILVVAAGAAALIFKNAITAASSKLP